MYLNGAYKFVKQQRLWKQSDGSKIELSRSYHRHTLPPFKSLKGEDDKWTHTPTDLSKEDAKVKAIAEVAWDNDTKTAYKAFIESQSL